MPGPGVRLPDRDASRVVLIGTSKYEDDDLPDLDEVRASVHAMQDQLCNRVTGIVTPDRCRILLDEPDSGGIGKALTQAGQEAQDLLLVYFAGHGLLEQVRGELFLATGRSNRSLVTFTALKYEGLRDAVLASSAKVKCVILDCCFSGRAIGQPMSDAASQALGQIDIRGTFVLTSASPNQVSLILPGEERTAFTGRLLSVLQDGIPGGPALLSLQRVYQELKRAMTAEGLPEPRGWNFDTAGNLAIGVNPACTAASAQETLTASLPRTVNGGQLDRARPPGRERSHSREYRRRRLLIGAIPVVAAAVALLAVGVLSLGPKGDRPQMSPAPASPAATGTGTPGTNSRSASATPITVVSEALARRGCLSTAPLNCVLDPAVAATGNPFAPKTQDKAALTATGRSDLSCRRTRRPGCFVLHWNLPAHWPDSSATFGVTYEKGIDLTRAHGGLDLSYRLRQGKLKYFEVWVRDASGTARQCKLWKNLDSRSWYMLHIRFDDCKVTSGRSGPSAPINWAKIFEFDIVLNSASGAGAADIDEITFRP